LVLVKDLVAQSSGETVRLLLLNRVWNLQWDYTPDALQDAAVSFEALHQAAGRAGVDGVDEVMGALANDLNVPAALEIALARGGVAARTLADVLKV
jgi:cysteinyl-tRNA synthetase